MKFVIQIILILTFVQVSLISSLRAQYYYKQYVNSIDGFLSPEKTWTEEYISYEDTWAFRYKFDTVPIVKNGNIYYHLLKANSEFSEEWVQYRLMRYDNNIVYLSTLEGDFLFYDFNLLPNDTFFMGNELGTYNFLVETLDSITLLNGDLKKRWILNPINPDNDDDNVIWVEGIGNLNGIMANFLPWSIDAPSSSLLCAYWMNSIVYDNPNHDGCWIQPTSTEQINKYNIVITPNPVGNEISIYGLDNNRESIYVYDYLGRLMHYGTENTIQVDDYLPGYYYVTIVLKDQRIKVMGFIKI